MSKTRWHIIPIIFTIISVIMVWGTAFAASDTLGYLQWILYGAGGIALAGVFCFKRELSSEQILFEAEKKAVKDEAENFQKIRENFEEEFEKRSLLIQKREAELSQKLITLHEWMEFPQGLDKAELHEQDMELNDFHKQDQAVLELIKKRTDELFNKIKNNHYQENGAFRKDRLTGDIISLIESVARIYNPESKNPMLETSVEQLLRSLNRTALHMLVLLEQLPIDLKNYNLKNVYETVQTGVKAYSAYKSAMPYWNYLRPVYYLGRFSLGGNPVTLGMGWALGELAKGSVKKISSHLANRYALNLLYDMVFIIGNESAGIFGGDFRHREANWIYGAELTELISNFPLSREILSSGLNEIGRLSLRSEYDRIFLYRCLAAHKSAGPEKFDTWTGLSFDERHSIARQLERFWKRNIADGKQNIPDSWKKNCETRLGVKVRMSVETLSESLQEKAGEGLVSLAGFLTDIKQRQGEDIPALLSETLMITYLDENQRREIMKKLMNEPPMIFDYPDMEASDSLLDDYIKDLINLHVRIYPHDIHSNEVLSDIFQYFRKDLKEMGKKTDNIYSDFFSEKLLPESPEKKIKPYIAKNLLCFLDSGEFPVFLYKDVKIILPDEAEERLEIIDNKELWLMGTEERLMLISIPEKESGQEAAFIWHGDRSVAVQRVKGRFKSGCSLRGGAWNIDGMNHISPDLLISGHTITRYETYFRPVIDFCVL